jgi:hypothetical protein
VEADLPDTSAGVVDYFKHKIQIDEALSNKGMLYTILHECIHAILFHAGRREHDEEIIQALEYGLVQLIQSNPQFIMSIVEAEAQIPVKFVISPHLT